MLGLRRRSPVAALVRRSLMANALLELLLMLHN
jgi:hypothetical protein